MTRFRWYGYEAQVDLEATRAWYAQAEDWDCRCGHCRNFLALARARKLPEELLAILDSLPIPPEKATYVCELYHDKDWREKGLLYEFCWRLPGQILDRPAGKDCGPNWGPWVNFPWGDIALGHEGDPCSEADDLPKPNFDLICIMHLPWVLDEPVDGPNSPNTKET